MEGCHNKYKKSVVRESVSLDTVLTLDKGDCPLFQFSWSVEAVTIHFALVIPFHL